MIKRRDIRITSYRASCSSYLFRHLFNRPRLKHIANVSSSLKLPFPSLPRLYTPFGGLQSRGAGLAGSLKSDSNDSSRPSTVPKQTFHHFGERRVIVQFCNLVRDFELLRLIVPEVTRRLHHSIPPPGKTFPEVEEL